MQYYLKLLAVLGATLTLAGAAPAQTTLRYKFKEGENLEYVMTQDQKMISKVAGKDIPITIRETTTVEMTLNTLKVDDQGNAQIEMSLGRVKIRMEGNLTGKIEADSQDEKESADDLSKILHQVAKELAGLKMTFATDPFGDVKNVDISEGSIARLKDLPGMEKLGDVFRPKNVKSALEGSIIPLLKEPSAKGATWSRKTDLKIALLNVAVDSKYTLLGPIEKNGKSLEKIAVRHDMKIIFDNKLPIKIEFKNAKSSGVVLFDNKLGRVVESTAETTMQVEIQARGQTDNMEITQHNTMLLKGSGKKSSETRK